MIVSSAEKRLFSFLTPLGIMMGASQSLYTYRQPEAFVQRQQLELDLQSGLQSAP